MTAEALADGLRTLPLVSESAESLWASDRNDRWFDALARYDAAIAAVPSARLLEHDVWYRTVLPALLASREPGYVLHDEMVRITEWKMARGVWRAPNLVLVRSNTPDEVLHASRLAAEQIPHPTKPVTALVALKGVGAATASALLAVMAPSVYPFFMKTWPRRCRSSGRWRGPTATTPSTPRPCAIARRSCRRCLGARSRRSWWSVPCGPRAAN